ncbi:hypothetical protein CC78DRAFT_551427 [Lojkania enalia]|uniref:Uncharacterized protein n=1 Tax=Lojkania enalia TaxID=147567 RepID=A0A9P4KGC8_9PLEO|nr:hypothetical protein CC78DRAFT_551427 [Didymosphaeria enalia]
MAPMLVEKAPQFDLASLIPASMTAFNRDGSLVSTPGVRGLVILGYASEGTFLTQEQQVAVIKDFIKSVDNILIITGIMTEGTKVVALEAQLAKVAGAAADLLYPLYAPQDRYKYMRHYDAKILIIPPERPGLMILTYHDECLLHTAFDVDLDYKEGRDIYGQMLAITKRIVALKHGLVARGILEHATARLPLMLIAG